MSNLSGKEKSRIILSVLSAEANTILSFLSPQSSKFLSSSLEDIGPTDPDVLNELVVEVLDEIERRRGSKNAVQWAQPQIAMPADPEVEEAPESPSEPEPQAPVGKQPTERPPTAEEVASVLSEQKPQIIAFYLSKTESNLRAQILESLPEDIKSEIDTLNVDAIPLSNKVYETLNRVINKPVKVEPTEEY
ncbi:MAG: flagellar motor switch protein FliG [Candidatus Marinamargulisbacteria bacterium]|jgi:flagellar motor switch protein FliG